MSGDECKAMVRPTVPPSAEFRVTESYRAVLRCTKYGSGRIKVRKWDGCKDTPSVIVAWDYALGHSENYANAVGVFLQRAGWDGEWAVSTCDGGAVAVYVPGTAGGGL